MPQAGSRSDAGSVARAASAEREAQSGKRRAKKVTGFPRLIPYRGRLRFKGMTAGSVGSHWIPVSTGMTGGYVGSFWMAVGSVKVPSELHGKSTVDSMASLVIEP